MTNLTHNFFYVFISILYMFRATSCPSSGESIVSIQHLVYVTLCRWPFRVQVGEEVSDLHMKRSPTQSDIYQILYWYNWFSWWWARGCSKHVENWNKCIVKIVRQVGHLPRNKFLFSVKHRNMKTPGRLQVWIRALLISTLAYVSVSFSPGSPPGENLVPTG